MSSGALNNQGNPGTESIVLEAINIQHRSRGFPNIGQVRSSLKHIFRLIAKMTMDFGMFLLPHCKIVKHCLEQIVSSIINSLGTSAGASLGMDPVVIFEANYANYSYFY